MRRNTLLSYFAVGICGLLMTVAANNEPPRLKVDFDSFATMNRADLSASLQQVRSVWYDLQDKTISELRGNSSKQVRLAAIMIAGDYRFDYAVPYLVPIIDFRDEDAIPKNSLGGASPWTEYPVAQALWRIGSPSVRYLLDSLVTSDDPLARRLCSTTLGGILGADVAKFTLQREIERQTTAMNKAAVLRLKTALHFLDEPK
jgi:hypothetical protein